MPLKVVIVGAGLGGLGAAIALRLAGHDVIVLEAAHEIGEIGAGIQCLPNSSRTLSSWGLYDALSKKASFTTRCDIMGWKGDLISSMDFQKACDEYGSPFWDFHRADLIHELVERAVELGAELKVDSEVTEVTFDEAKSKATVFIRNHGDIEADLVIGADGINSKLREVVLGKPAPAQRTGDMAYRLLLQREDIIKNPELRPILEDKAVIYWYGPGAHVVTYALREGSLLNMVLLVPDNMPEDGPSTLQGYVDEMQDLFKAWDPRLRKLMANTKSVLRWRLCMKQSVDSWVHPSGCLALLGDSAHATLPYLASGAGMSFEDGAVLGECLSRLNTDSPDEKKRALAVYEKCRKMRTETVVHRGNIQQDLNHLDDGKEQEERDRKMKAFGKVEEEWQKGNRGPLPAGLVEGEDPLVWRRYGVGDWLLRYDCQKSVEELWSKAKI